MRVVIHSLYTKDGEFKNGYLSYSPHLFKHCEYFQDLTKFCWKKDIITYSHIPRLPRNKATGIDELASELLKTINSILIKIICCICNKVKWPSDWSKSVFITIPKVVGTKNYAEHRTIALISHASKILLRTLLKRIERTIDDQIAEEQTGFRKESRSQRPNFN